MSRKSRKPKTARNRAHRRVSSRRSFRQPHYVLPAIITLCILTTFGGVYLLTHAARQDKPLTSKDASFPAALPHPHARPVQPDLGDDDQCIQTDTLSEGDASFFVYDTDEGSAVRFFIVNLPGTKYAAALDTCYGCFRKGLDYQPWGMSDSLANPSV